tara:strand:+ start:4509 stop:5054 length:546 start_codon:yes stop_codon:yes gene_type:complete
MNPFPFLIPLMFLMVIFKSIFEGFLALMDKNNLISKIFWAIIVLIFAMYFIIYIGSLAGATTIVYFWDVLKIFGFLLLAITIVLLFIQEFTNNGKDSKLNISKFFTNILPGPLKNSAKDFSIFVLLTAVGCIFSIILSNNAIHGLTKMFTFLWHSFIILIIISIFIITAKIISTFLIDAIA